MRLFALLFLPLALNAGGTSVNINGVVLDPSGRPVEGAHVECSVAKTYSSVDGRFKIEGVSKCAASIAKNGFAESKIDLQAGADNRITLQVGGVSETVVVTAARTETTPEEAGVAATTIGAKDLAARDYPAIVDALRDVAGIQISNTNGRGGLTSIYTRGAQSTGTLILLDGVPLNDPGGQINLAHFTSSAIDRVEVVRGPESALFGAEASAGVIQLFTKRGDSESTVPHGEVSYERGNFQTDRWLANVAGGWGNRIDYALAADQLHTAGEFPNNFYRNTSGTADIGVRITDATQVRAIFNEYDAHLGTPNQVGYGLTDYSSNEETQDSTAGLRVNDTRGANFFQQFGFGYNRMRDAFNGDDVWGPYNIAGLLRQAAGPLPRIYLVSLLDPNNLPNPATLAPDERIATYSTSLYGFPSLNVTERTTANYQGTLTNAGGALVFGYDYDHQSATIEGPSATRDNNGLFAQKQQRIGERLFLSGGFRVERSSAYGTEFTPRGAASFLLFHEHGPLSSTFFRLSAGHGVTEPSIYDTYVQSPYYHGNTGLRPERTNSYEAGLVQEWFGRRVHTEVNVFRNSFDNLIAFTTDTWQNVESSWARGIEASGQAKPIPGLLLSGGYTRLYSRITNSVTPGDPVFGIGQELLRRPRNSGFVSVQVSPRRCSLIAGARFVGERQDADFVFGINRNPGYQNVYASASCQVAKHFTPVVSGENLLNERYEEVLGFASLSRTVMGGIRIGW